MTTMYNSEAEADKTAEASLDLEKGGSDVHQTSMVVDHDDKRTAHSAHAHPAHDFRAEERNDIPAAVDSHVALDNYPDGGLTAWLVTIGVWALKCSHDAPIDQFLCTGILLELFDVSCTVWTPSSPA